MGEFCDTSNALLVQPFIHVKCALEKKNKKRPRTVTFTCFLLSAEWASHPEDFLVSPVQAPKAKQIKKHNVYNETYVWKNLWFI